MTLISVPAGAVEGAVTLTANDRILVDIGGETRAVPATALETLLNINNTAASASADDAAASALAAAASASAAQLATGQNYLLDRASGEAMDISPTPSVVYLFGRDVYNDGGAGKYSQTTVADIVSEIHPTPSNDVELYLPLHGPEDFSAFPELSGNAHAVTVTGNVHADGAQRFYGHRMAYFDGSDQISVADDTAWRLDGDFTVQAVVNVDDLAADRFIVGQTQDISNEWSLTVLTTGAVEFSQTAGGVAAILATTPAGAVTAGQTHDIRVVRSGSTVRLYVDSDDLASVGVAAATYAQNSPLLIGDSSVGSFLGYIGRLTIKSSATWEIAYVPGASGSTPGPTIPRPDFHHLPEECYFQAASGEYFALDEALPNIRQMGALGTGTASIGTGAGGIDEFTGDDDSDAGDALISYMGVRSVIGRISKGGYYMAREFVNDSDQLLYFEDADLYRDCNAYSSAMRLLGKSSGFINPRLHYGASVASGPYRGDRHSGVVMGDQFWTNGTPVFSRDLLLDGAEFFAYNLGQPIKNHIVRMGRVWYGRVLNCTDEDSPARVDRFELCHWGGEGEGYQASISETHHVRFGITDNCRVFNAEVGGFYSAVTSHHVTRCLWDGVRQAFRVFSGDETNRVAQEQPETLGRGLVFEDCFIQNIEDEASEPLVEFSSLGTSSVLTATQDQLDQTVTVRNLQVSGSPNTGKILARFFQFAGRVLFECDFKEFAGQVISCDRSENVTCVLNGVTSYDDVVMNITRSSDFKLSGRVETTDLAAATVLKMDGGEETNTLSAAGALGDTTLTLSSGLADDVFVGSLALVEGVPHRVTAPADVGATEIEITPLKYAGAISDSVALRQYTTGVMDAELIGGRFGWIADRCDVTTGPSAAVNYSGQDGLELQSNAAITGPLSSKGAGQNRSSDGGLNTACISVDPSSTFSHTGGRLGGPYINYIVRGTGTETDDARYIATGVDFHEAISGAEVFTSLPDRELRGCRSLAILGGVVQTRGLLET